MLRFLWTSDTVNVGWCKFDVDDQFGLNPNVQGCEFAMWQVVASPLFLLLHRVDVKCISTACLPAYDNIHVHMYVK